MSDSAASSGSQLERTFRPYPDYKDSGVEWLGEIPAGWDVVRNLGVFGDRREKGHPDLPIYSVTQNRGVIPQEEVSVKVVRPSENLGGYKRIRPGDLVYNKMRMWQGAVGTATATAIVSPAYVVCSPREEIETRFFEYLYRTPLFVAESGRFSYGICDDMNSLRFDDFKGIYSLVPPRSEQRAIVGFLDREAAKIDALVAKKERLIELLQEKRTALITQAVTKGLDPNVPMKDSGVEWLGEIPAHWTATALKRIGDLQAGAGFPDEEQGISGEEIPFFKVGDMGSPGNERELRECPHTVSEETARRLRAFVFRPGTIAFAKVGAALLLNRRRLLVHSSCMDNNMMGFMPIRCDPSWALWWLSGLDMGEIANPGAVPSVNEGQMRETPVAVPPMEEQRAIATHLDRETAGIDSLIGRIRDAIRHLKELRTALISAAVTGKIDVRSEAA